MNKQSSRAQFATRLGVIATTVGSAVGLGNIWRFPYEAGNNGGGAFMLIYIAFILILGIPVICAEFALGRAGRSNIFGTFRKLHTKGWWQLTGLIGIIASLMIISFYSVVAGWTLEYFFQSVRGALTDPQDLGARFESFSSGWRSVAWTVIFLIINFMVVRNDVRKGIERISNILMPVLFIILIVFCINSLLMPGARQGLTFLFKPDFSAITPSVVLGALGQAFFSLSLGLGCMLTYASYFNNKVNIIRSASITAGLDTLVAIMSGVMIFPAVFTFGVSPQAGPTLVFEVLPDIFSRMPLGSVWSALFFLMLFTASLTSTISMSEISMTYFSEQFGMSRRKSSVLNTAIAIGFGVLCAMSFGIIKGFHLFDIFNYVSSNVFLPIGGILISIFAGWIIDKKILRDQLTNNGEISTHWLRPVVFAMKYVAPIGLVIVLLMSVGLI